MSAAEGSSPAGGSASLTSTPSGTLPKIKVHNGDAYKDVMEAADWAPPVGIPRAPKLVARNPKQLSAKERSAKHREAFLQKQSVREQELKQRFDVVKRETERRLRDTALRREHDFEERFATFRHNNETLVVQVEDAIRADEAWRQRKKERLFAEWSTKVFEPMQADITGKLASLSRDDIERKRRHMLQCFLDESNKKTNGLFRDIIIESDYDPMSQAAAATIVYKAPNIADDPTKSRAVRETGDRLASGLLPATAPGAASPLKSRNAVPVTMWDRMEATPYGRYSGSETADGADVPVRKPHFMKSAVVMDHYAIPTGDEGERVKRAENCLRGKRMTGAPYAPTIGECLTFVH
jgi:hypothetical protein